MTFLSKIRSHYANSIVADTGFPETLYITPDKAGETYIYAKDEMIAALKDLKKVSGYAFSLADCTEIDLVSKKQDFAIYETAKTKKPQQVKIVKKGGEFKAKWL